MNFVAWVGSVAFLMRNSPGIVVRLIATDSSMWSFYMDGMAP